ncbi:hypothetical protein J5N97_024195 [Dioscorea zingiberensis]|uniref:Uncharacterized protein n=1 Tax=Dioscorea zingiberensis TaxID=325984 RepID=A0A9D5H8L7_9LILI|nr:hypothetical protein J5N97_024195 [Dioscorea zingiberensis]
MEISKEKQEKGGRKLERQRSRLQMQAPSSIEVAPAGISFSDWNIAIPLLSPLDLQNPLQSSLSSSSSFDQELRRREEKDSEPNGTSGWRAWKHPAAPFHYEPVPGNAPAFLLPSHCTS